MNDSLEDTATLYVLDQLGATDRAAFEARLLREPELAALVRELESGLAHGVRALPPHEPPAALLGRIETQIDVEGLNPAARVQPARRAGATARPAWAAFAGWGIAAVIAVSLATLAIESVRRPASPVFVVVGLDANRSTFTELPPATAAQDPDTRFIQLASLAENYWHKPADLPRQPAPPGNDSRGYALFDPSSRQGFIAIEQLPALTGNQRYHLWVADTATGRVRDAGALPLAGLNRGLYSFALEPTDNAKSGRPLLFVTAEDAGAASPRDQPQGKVVLGQRTF